MGKKQGYFLVKEVVLHEEISLDAEEDSQSMEYQLYPYLVEWMESNGYSRAKDISSSRRRQKMGESGHYRTKRRQYIRRNKY